MTDIKLDLNPASPTYKDAVIVDGDYVLVDGPQAILQNILQTLSVFLGEWFMDNTIGVPYFQQILTKNPNQATIDAIFIDKILSVAGVLQLTAYNFSPNFMTRQLALSFKAQVTNGTVDYAGLIGT